MLSPKEVDLKPVPHIDVQPINRAKYDITRAAFTLWWTKRGGLTTHSTATIGSGAGGEIASANHDSWWDPWAVAEAYHQENGAYLRSMAKEELWKKRPLIGSNFGEYLTDLGGFPVKRKSSFFQQPEALANVSSIAYSQEVLMMYPQGTRRNHNVGEVPLDSLESGIGFIAIKFGLPIRPIGIRGTAERLLVNVAIGDQLEVNQQDFDPTNRREVVEIGREFVPPLMEELQELMHDQVKIADSKRKEMLELIPPRLLRGNLLG